MRLSLADRIAAWIVTLILAPLLFAAALPFVSLGVNAYIDWPTFVRMIQSGSFFSDMRLLPLVAGLLGVYGTLPTLILGVPAASVLERSRVTRIAYAAVGFLLGLGGSFVILPLTFGAPFGDSGGAIMAGGYGALVALTYRTLTLNTERAHARRPGAPSEGSQ